MDPLTQGLLGATLPQAVAKNDQHKIAAMLGFLAGMSADLDVLIRSSSDPLLFLEFHRQFTHSLLFIPIGGLICALLGYYLIGKSRRASFNACWLYCTLGYATHALLDACTSYGTQLLWPFSNERIAWNIISIIDPLYTVPLLLLLATSLYTARKKYAVVALCWVLAYPLIGLWQHHRVEQAALAWSKNQQLSLLRLNVNPTLGNLLLWKAIYETETHFYTVAIRAGFDTRYFNGEAIKKLDPTQDLRWLPIDSQQAIDIARFKWFSNGFIAMDPGNTQRIFDLRYSLLPNRIDGLWGIELTPDKPGEHVRYYTNRDMTEQQIDSFKQMLLNK